MSRYLLAALLLAACAHGQPTAPPAPEGARVSREQFRSLGWLEGRWLGRRVGLVEVLLATRFVDDTTLEIRMYEGRPFTEATDSGAAMLAGGRVRVRLSVSEWMAVSVDSTSIHLAPVGNTPSDITFTQADADAMLVRWIWHDEQGQTQRRTATFRRLHR